MIADLEARTLAAFCQKPAEALDRLHETGEPQILTVNGERRGVLATPRLFEELCRDAQVMADVGVMRMAMRAIDACDCQEAGVFFDNLRSRLLAMKRDAEKNVGGSDRLP